MERSPWIVSDATWERIAPLLHPRERRFRNPGRLPLDDRRVLQGILYVLVNGIGWEHLPQELGFGSGMTCWRRLRRWQLDGVWLDVQTELSAALEGTEIDWPRALAGAYHAPAAMTETPSASAESAQTVAPLDTAGV